MSISSQLILVAADAVALIGQVPPGASGQVRIVFASAELEKV
jgi:hypothetical protein